jgi:carboxylesterase type B
LIILNDNEHIPFWNVLFCFLLNPMMNTKFYIVLLLPVLLLGCGNTEEHQVRDLMMSQYGQNREVVGDYDHRLAVKCVNGIFLGHEDDHTIFYKGIPYAKSPVGVLRWKAPMAPDSSNKVFDACYFGKMPIQTHFVSQRSSYYQQGEDCLYLNIWRNVLVKPAKRPVMVFIHGGSYGWGGTADPMFNGANFVRENKDVVLVTIGYRLGLFGFVDFSSVKGGNQYKDACNLGLLDQIAALKWIKQNIAGFGGDPDNITIFGESAGGGSVSLLTVMPQAKGLFHRAIVESGSVALTYSKQQCQGFTKRLLKASGAHTMADLARMSEKELVSINEKINDYANFPERDGRLLPTDLYRAYADGAGRDVDLLIGTNAEESRFWIGSVGGLGKFKLMLPVMYENDLSKVSSHDVSYIDSFMAMQPNGNDTWGMSEFYNELMFRCPAIRMAEGHSGCGGHTYMYYWMLPSEKSNYGACHAVELAYVFNNLNDSIYTGAGIRGQRALLAHQVQQMWVNFAKTGNPSIPGFNWLQYDAKHRYTACIGARNATAIKMEGEPLSVQRQKMSPLLRYNFNGCYSDMSLGVPFVYKCAILVFVVLLILVGGIVVTVKHFKK